MIHINVTNTEIRMDGHAGCSENGKDLACAAASALTITLANALQELAGADISAILDPGHAVIKWEELNEKGRLLVEFWYLGMEGINSEYNCITFG